MWRVPGSTAANSTNSEGEQLRAHYGDGYHETPMTYVEQADLSGLADALLAAAPTIEGPFVECPGDNVVAAETVARLIDHHQGSDASATLGVEDVATETARGTGVCAFDDDGRLTGLYERYTGHGDRISPAYEVERELASTMLEEHLHDPAVEYGTKRRVRERMQAKLGYIAYNIGRLAEARRYFARDPDVSRNSLDVGVSLGSERWVYTLGVAKRIHRAVGE